MDDQPQVILEQTPAVDIIKEADKKVEKARAMNEQTETNQLLLLAQLVEGITDLMDRLEIAIEVMEQRALSLQEVTTEATQTLEEVTTEQTTETETTPIIETEASAKVGKKKLGLSAFLL